MTSRRAQKKKRGPALSLGGSEPRVAPVVRRPARSTWLIELEKYRRLSAEEWQRVGALVAGARAVGATWKEIGEALGVTPQAAHKRFATRSVATERSEGGRATERSEGGR